MIQAFKKAREYEESDAGLDILDKLQENAAIGLGGRVTSLAVHVQMMPCHIASLPLAVNIQCHASRHLEIIL